MAKVAEDEGPISDWSRPPGPANTSSLFMSMPVLGGTENNHASVENETTIENQVSKIEAKVDTPPSPASTTNPWSTSATLLVLSEIGTHDQSELAAAGEEQCTSPTPWSTSATLPVSPESGHHGDEAPTWAEATTAAPVSEKKKFSKAEYQVAFRDFLTYSSWGDKLLLFAACFASICAGVTLPLINVVFGMLLHLDSS
jgi:hypothetical protein